ncbi:MAG TPA: radical SAM protein [Candidatus Binatia bacterium]|nr:radical SAM protein [Candidatus Binatia bacterium]
MARVALIKLFTGLNLGVAQLSAELRRAGHETRIVYFKDFLLVPKAEASRYLVTDHALTLYGARGEETVWNCYTPCSEREYALLFDVLDEFRPDLIGLSLNSLTMKVGAEVTARLKARYEAPVLWGGAGPTLEPEWSIGHADLVCIGEGEEVIVALADRIDRDAPVTDVAGLWSRRADGEVVRNAAGPLVDIERIAIPDLDPARTVHINDDRIAYGIYPVFPGTQYVIMTQRGCPFSCSFCVESVYQDIWGKQGSLRRRSVDVVIEELVAAKRDLPIRQIMFYDDVFTVNPRWLREFAPRYRREVGLPFWCYTYPTTTRTEDIRLLKDAGMRAITIGIQSGSDRILRDHFNRPVARAKAYEAARILTECGVPTFFDLITKVHFETVDDLRETFDFLLDFPKTMRTIGFAGMVSFPEYGYTKQAEAQGMRLAVSDRDYRFFHKLYLLTRTDVPRSVVRAAGRSRLLRRFPSLLDPLLPKTLPQLFLDPADGEAETGVLSSTYAQAVLPGWTPSGREPAARTLN